MRFRWCSLAALCKLMRQGLDLMGGRTVKKKKRLQKVAMACWVTAGNGDEMVR